VKKYFSFASLVVAIFCVIAPSLSYAQGLARSCNAKSPPHTIALVELYTSEGCSSCPPADKFISQFTRDAKRDTQQFIPLSLHVDYWNSLGWKDVFSRAIFTERQRWLAGLASSRTVYTPEFFVAAKELRNWQQDLTASIQQINATPAQAHIGLQLSKHALTQLSVQFDVKTVNPADGTNKLFYALTESGISNDIKSGENQGARLQHDFVVREFGEAIAINGLALNVVRTLDIPKDANKRNLTMVAFVENSKGVILQALSLPLCQEN
jgi:hypothetical protein